MGIIDGFKSLGRGISRLPGAINEARFNHETRMVPIGKNPDTGEDILIPAEELQAMDAMYDPASGQIMRPETVRTGPSKFGQFLSQGLPRMLDAGVAAATAPGNGQGGFLAGLRGMDIGNDRLQKRDMLAYQMQRQRINDAALDEQRRSQAEENRMQVEMYRQRMNQPPADPLAGLKARAAAAGLVEGTLEYQDFMLRNGAVSRDDEWLNLGGNNIFNKKEKKFYTAPEREKPAPAERNVGAMTWLPDKDDPNIERGHMNVFNPADPAKSRLVPVENAVRPRQQRPVAGPRPRQSTPAQVEAAAARGAADRFLAEAGQDFDKAMTIARQRNASIAVQNILLDAKKRATPPAPRGGGGGGGKPKSDIPTFNTGGGWRSAKSKILGGK